MIIPALLKGGIEGLRESCKLTPGELLRCSLTHRPLLMRPRCSLEAHVGKANQGNHRGARSFRGQRVHVRVQVRWRACSGEIHIGPKLMVGDTDGHKVHLLENGEIAVFSRNSENMSAKYPDLVESIPRVSKGKLPSIRQ